MSSADVVRIAQSVASYKFEQPSYAKVIDDMIGLMVYLRDNKSEPSSSIHSAVRSLYWDIVIKIAVFNGFKNES